MIAANEVGALATLREELGRFSESDYLGMYSQRMKRFRAAMTNRGFDAAVLTLGADVPWLVGYEPMPLERVTALVLRSDEQPMLLVPALEAPRVKLRGDLYSIRPWNETEDPFSIIQSFVGDSDEVLVSDRGWTSWLLELQKLSGSGTTFSKSSMVLGELRRAKDRIEALTLALAAAAADEVAYLLQGGEMRLEGRQEKDISDEIVARLIDFGHQRANFAIVGSGPNSASPHHEPTQRVVKKGDAVVCDFGGTYSVNEEPGYCSDMTRNFHIGEPDSRFREAFRVLRESQDRARISAVAGVTLADADAVARRHIESHGLGEYFIHRLGHGIGLEEHEEPYLSPNSKGAIKDGDCYSIEPGIYFPHTYGARIEDIVLAQDGVAISLNRADRDLVVFG